MKLQGMLLEPQTEDLKVAPLLSPLALSPNLHLNLEVFLQELYQVLEEMYYTVMRYLARLHPRRRRSCQKGASLKTKLAALFTLTMNGRMDTVSIQEGLSLDNHSTGRTKQALNSMHYNMEAFKATKGEGHISLSHQEPHLPLGVPERILRLRGTSYTIQKGAQTW